MPPLPLHRELFESERQVSPEINRWEPSIAAGADLLPIPSWYELKRETTFDGSEGFEPGTTTMHKDIKTYFDNLDRVGQQYRSSYSVHGIHSQSDSLEDRTWINEQQFYITGGNQCPDYRSVPQGIMSVSDDTLQVVRGQEIAWVQIEKNEEGETDWIVKKWDHEGYHHVVETVDTEGRLTRVKHSIHNSSMGEGDPLFGWSRITETTYSYGQSGKLTKEVRKTLWDGKDTNNKEVEKTIFRYLPSGVVSHVTTLSDGTEIRRGTRYYDEKGRFLRAEVIENLPGEGRVRKLGQTAISYDHRERMGGLPMW